VEFQQALEDHPAPKAIGDVHLRFDEFVLIGETVKPLSSWAAQGALIAGICCGVPAMVLALSLQSWGPTVASALTVATAGFFGAAALLDQWGKRRRRFVANFESHTLRLDFSTRFRGLPRTVVVPFSSVQRLERVAQADGNTALVVELATEAPRESGFREVLIAHVTDDEEAALSRIERVLTHAIDPRDGGDSPISTYRPA
jgi:hypothetical protein